MKKTFFARRFQTIFKQKCSYLRPFLSITFPQAFRISKNIGHPTSGSGGKKTVKRYLKSEQTDRQTDGQTDGRTDRRIFRLIESIGPEGRSFEKNIKPLLSQNVMHFDETIKSVCIDLVKKIDLISTCTKKYLQVLFKISSTYK